MLSKQRMLSVLWDAAVSQGVMYETCKLMMVLCSLEATRIVQR